MKRIATSVLAVLGMAAFVNVQGQTISVDAALNEYVRIGGVSGNLNSIGSDTLNNLMALWAEGFRKQYPNVNIQIEGKGSSTAPPALTEGTSNLGPMSRKMKDNEVDAVEQKYGFKPTPVGVALDALAVYVHKDNPIGAKGLDLKEVDGIFSKTFNSGATDIKTWGGVGLEGTWANMPISLYGRNSASGTYGYFKKVALSKGDYKDTVKEQPGSASVVNGVTNDKSGIGYSGIGYRTSGVIAIPLSKGAEKFAPNYDNVLSGKYPLGRMLYVYVIKAPNEKLPPVVEEFLKYVLSKAGQEIVVKDGYLPLPAKVAEAQLKLIQ